MNLLRISVVILAGLAVGCGKDEDADDHDQPAAGHMEHKEDGGADPFADLSAADAKLAKAQKTCPVSDEELGSMGTPVKVMVGEQPVFLCCDNCRKELLANADKYLAKLKAK